MMIEQEIVMLVQSNPAVAALAPIGGFLSELPKDQTLPSWTYRVISEVPEYGLTTLPGLVMSRLQIDCYGLAGLDAINLSAAIDAVLNGYCGPVASPPADDINKISRTDKMDLFDDARRSYRRMTEYEVLWFQN